MRRLWACLLCLAGLAGAAPASAGAADLVVSRLADDAAPGSLRAAINNANAVAGPDRVLFAQGARGTIDITADLPTITQALQIVGPGSGRLTIDAGDAFHPLSIDVSSQDAPVSISGLRIINGRATEDGGGIRSRNAALSLTDVVIADSNAGISGGALRSDGGAVTIVDSSFTGNSAQNGGGLVFNAGISRPVTITRSTIASNTATNGSRGGIDLDDAETATVTSSVIAGNSASSAAGGIGLGFHDGPVLIQGTTISGNTAGGDGGGIEVVNNDEGQIEIRNSTISGNSGDWGGGLFIWEISTANPVIIESTTIAGNTSRQDRGGGIYANPDPGVAATQLRNSIVADNIAAEGPDIFVGEENRQVSLSYSLVENPAPASVVASDQALVGIDPLLAPLADNGGPTRTHALKPGSPAIDAGKSSLKTDQRGRLRPVNGSQRNAVGGNGADIGAFELQPFCKGEEATITASKPTTKGTAKRDVIVGRNGKDRIIALGGNDIVCGRGGNDTINGGKGNDTLLGQGGRDTLRGGPGKDKLLGGAGRDTLRGGPGKDTLRGGAGKDDGRQ